MIALDDSHSSQQDPKSYSDEIGEPDREKFVRKMSGFKPNNEFEKKLTIGVLFRNGLIPNSNLRHDMQYRP